MPSCNVAIGVRPQHILPWLRYLRNELGGSVHFWPFDGWKILQGRSAIVEAYPSLFRHGFAPEGLTPDQHDAYSTAAWMQQADRNGQLSTFLNPNLSPPERANAGIEGWIIGVG